MHLAANVLIRHLDALAVEIPADFAENVFLAGLLEIGQHDFLSVSLGFRSAQTLPFCCPFAEHFIAAGSGLESQVLVMRELLLETFFTLVERRHAVSSPRIEMLLCASQFRAP